jgi:ABC-type protease/lipase transport system fused ATPase/permease subunit
MLKYFKFINSISKVTFLSLLNGIILLSPSFYLLIVYNKILTFQNLNSLFALTLIYLIIIFLGYTIDNLRANSISLSGKTFIQKVQKYVLKKYPNVEGWNASKIMRLDSFLQSPYIFYQYDLLLGSLYIILLYFFEPLLSLYALIASVVLFLTIRIGSKKIHNETDNQSIYGSWSFFHAIGIKDLLNKNISQLITPAKMDRPFKTNIALNKKKYLKFVLTSGSLAVSSYLVINEGLNPGIMFMVLVLMSRILAPAELYATGYDFINIHERYLKKLILDESFYKSENNEHSQKVNDLTIKEIKINDLQLIFDQREKKNNLQFQLSCGKNYLIIGPNGSGKTTFLNTLLGTTNPKNGKIIYNDIPAFDFPSNLRHKNFNYMPQGSVISPVSIKDFLSFQTDIEIKSLEKIAQHLGLMPKILSFKEQWDTPLDQFASVCSPGELQKLKLLQSTLDTKSWNFFDEPDHFLDGIGMKILINHFVQIKKDKKSIVLVSHKSNLIDFFDEIIVVDQLSVRPPINKIDFLKQIENIKNLNQKK